MHPEQRAYKAAPCSTASEKKDKNSIQPFNHAIYPLYAPLLVARITLQTPGVGVALEATPPPPPPSSSAAAAAAAAVCTHTHTHTELSGVSLRPSPLCCSPPPASAAVCLPSLTLPPGARSLSGQHRCAQPLDYPSAGAGEARSEHRGGAFLSRRLQGTTPWQWKRKVCGFSRALK